MRLRSLAVNGLVLAAAAFLFVSSPERRPARLVPAVAEAPPLASSLSDLEDQASRAPNAAKVSQLVQAYLDRGQPGLAAAVLDGAPPAVRADPEVAHLHARVLFHRGKAREALAAARELERSCAPGSTAGRCATWLSAKASRQRAFLEEVVAAGIEDPLLDPSGVRGAYERSTREVRLVAMR